MNTNRFFTIEVYNRRQWSDKYSPIYSTKEEAEERARQLYNGEFEDAGDYSYKQPIHTCYRVKETIENTIIHEL